MGIPVVSPHELHPASEGTPWDWYLRRDLTQLVKCSRIVMLNDWHLSRGARLEHEVATRLELDVYYPHDYAKLGI
ncbi:hypothetical protein SEA_UKULELE_106 [Mycobacterium phage Ukulele]|nr:hypothetical protein SEA_UKULELE_106 [Mycobacterium phage Ukulele]